MNASYSVRFLGLVFCASFAALVSVPAVLADGGANHKAVQARPISLGTSGGNINDISMLYCCSGTLGALVADGGGTRYILGNNHVLARSNAGSVGDPVNQPGMIDQNCQQAGIVANLTDWVPIQMATKSSTPLNQVDAAIAQIVPGAVRNDGALLDIGPVSASVMQAFVTQGVQKSGRTTGRTTGAVSAIDVTVDVGYSASCGGASTKKARFVNQIRIVPGAFSAGGDSGSLILENGSVNPADNLPRAVGLLFAGSSTSTIANPIASVLSLLGVSMVGGAPVTVTTGTVAGVVVRSVDNAPIAGASVSADTGQTATTGASGAYTLTSVPTGARTVTASAAGYVTASQSASVAENVTSTVGFSLDTAVTPTLARVGCVTYSTKGGSGGKRDLVVTVRALDDLGNPLSGATVNIALYLNGSSYGNGTGATTNSNGQATYTTRNAPNGSYTTTVTNIIASSLTFDSGSTPANLFVKGTDTSPKSFCNDGATPSDAAGSLDTQISRARAAKARNSGRLLGIPGVQGHGVGFDENGRPVIEVYLANENAAARAQIPATIENVPVRVVVSGEFTAY